MAGQQLLGSLPSMLTQAPLLVTVPLLVLISPVLLLGVVVAGLAVQTVWRVVEREVLGIDFYRDLRSPKHTSPWWPIVGHVGHIFARPPADGHLDFLNEVGVPVFTYQILTYHSRLAITDPVAIAYLLSSAHNYDYPKPEQSRTFLKALLGEGILVAEGETHKRARRVLQPAFNLAAIRNLTPLFFRHANQLGAKLAAKVDLTEGPADAPFLPGQSALAAKESRKGAPVLDIMTWLGMTTMDVIGEAGFGHHFHALANIDNEKPSKDIIARAFSELTSMTTDITYFQILLFVLTRYRAFRWLDKLPTKRRHQMRSMYQLLETTSQKIIDQKRADVLREIQATSGVSLTGDGAVAGGKGHGGGGDTTSAPTKEFFEDLSNSGAPKDLMHLMLRANLAADLPPQARLHDHELLGQITTLLLAGQETTSTQLTWCLWMLAQPKHQHIQQELRRQLRDLFSGRDEVRYEELQSLRLLEKVMLEIMRLIAAVPSTTRVANRDDAIPLSKAYPTRDGKRTFDRVPIKRGTEIFILIQVLNRHPALWGDTADEFDPDRWDALPDAVRELTESKGTAGGMPANGLFTFIAGPRGCIGKAFALAEFKAILAVLLRDFQFDVIEGWEVERKQGIVVRPRIKGQEDLGMQMPLRISRAP